MFTTWGVSQNRKIKYVCTCYGLHTITPDLLVCTILDIIVSLEMYGCIITAVTGHGAVKNLEHSKDCVLKPQQKHYHVI